MFVFFDLPYAPKKKRSRIEMRKIFFVWMLFLLAALSGVAWAAQSITISDGDFFGYDVYGNSTTPERWDSDGDPHDNVVNVNGGTITYEVYGSWSDGNATGNSVNWTKGTIDGNIFGGSAPYGTASGNSVTVNGSVTHSGWIMGAYGEAAATGNSVTATDTDGKAHSREIFDFPVIITCHTSGKEGASIVSWYASPCIRVLNSE